MCTPSGLDEARVTSLREALAAEIELLSGYPITLFHTVDIGLGQAWDQAVLGELDAASFLIPLVQPGLFTREECREQLDLFLARELALGRSDLVLPIHYIECPGFTRDSDDDLMRTLAGRTPFDWRALRLARGRAWQDGVGKLAARIVEAFRRKPPAKTQPPAPAKELRILLLAANPKDRTELDVGQELRNLRDIFGRRDLEARVRIDGATAVTLEEMTRQILAHRPHVLHFCGHGSPKGEPLLLDPDTDAARPVSLARLRARLCKLRELRCVFFNACYSARIVEALALDVPAVFLGMRTVVTDADARAFSSMFYRQVAEGADLRAAYDVALSVFEGRGGLDDPQINCHSGVEPRSAVLLPARPR